MAPTRLLLVANSRSPLSLELTRAAIDAVRSRSDIEIVGLCDTSPAGRARVGAIAEEASAAVVKRAFGQQSSVRGALLLARGLPGTVTRPARGDPNDPHFLSLLDTSLRPDASLWLGSVRVACEPLLRALSRSVNYHNGSLPGIRGLRATAWSIYTGASTTGFSFHLMDESIDTGPVLVSGEIAVPPRATTWALESAKTAAAITALPSVLDALVHGDEGRPQVGPSASYRHSDYLEATTIREPWLRTSDDLDRRLRAFGRITLTLPIGDVVVTEVCAVAAPRPRRAAVTFVTADGVTTEAVRFRFLPLQWYRLAGHVDRLRRQRRTR